MDDIQMGTAGQDEGLAYFFLTYWKNPSGFSELVGNGSIKCPRNHG